MVTKRGDSITIGVADIVGGFADIASLIDSAPTDPEELERYIDSIRSAQNAGFVIGAAVAAIELLSERLEEMKSGIEDVAEINEDSVDEDMMM